MILARLLLSNFKNFGEKPVRFAPGINVLQGPNGSGKTTILEGIEFAFYASVAGKTGLEPLIKVGEAVSSVELTFESSEVERPHEYRVVRQLAKGESGASSTQTQLFKDDVEVSSKKAAIDEALLDLLGISHSSYGNSCYIRQGEIRALLEAGKDREREIDRMLGLGVFEDAWRDLRRVQSGLERDVSSANEDLIKAEAEMDNLSSISKDLTQRMEEKVRLEVEVKTAREKLGDLTTLETPAGPAGDLIRLERARSTQSQKIIGMEDQLSQLEDRIEGINDRLLEMESEMLRRRNRIDSLGDERQSLIARIDKVDDESKRAEESSRDMEAEVHRLEAMLEVQNDFISSFSRMEVRGEAKCPLCGSELTKDHARETRRSLNGKVRDLQERIDRKATDIRRLEKVSNSSSSRRDRLRSQLSEVEKELSEAEAENTGLQVSRDEIDADTASLLTRKRELEEELGQEKDVLAEIEKQLSETPGEMGIDEQMADSRAEYLANKRILSRLEEEIPQLMEKLAEQQAKKTQLRDARERHGSLNKKLEQVRDIRWAFNNIGPYARQKLFISVAERARDLFSRIYSTGPISEISLTQDYDVQAVTPSGVKLDSKQMSIGERVMAGLALRIALAQVWQGKTSSDEEKVGAPGFLILDEPTEYLDESNVRTLARTIAGLKALGQIIIVTHDQGLMEEIGKKSEINRIVLTRPRKKG